MRIFPTRTAPAAGRAADRSRAARDTAGRAAAEAILAGAQRTGTTAAILAAAGVLCAAVIGIAAGQDESPAARAEPAAAKAGAEAGRGAGWTGSTHAADVVAARRAVMLELERLIRPLDAYSAGEPGDPDALREAAGTISTLLLAVPHLFPPTTDVYDPDAEIPETLALPEIWHDFPAFYALADGAADAAADTLTAGRAELAEAAGRLRAACDACHSRFMVIYTPPAASEEDREFDFESLFPAE